MNSTIHLRPTLAVALVLALGASTMVAPEAYAADERRVLRARDVDTGADVSAEYARQAEEKRLEAIRRLKELLNRGAEGNQKAEMMLRLADLYFQQGRFLYLREMASFDVQYEACFNDENCSPDSLQPNNAGSRDWQLKSIKLYENILRNYPRYDRADQATFFLASAYQDTEQTDKAVDAFKKLVKLYPQSSYVPDAYVLIGEYYFENDNAYGALRAYLKATAFKEHEKYAFAMYKLAWCYYNVGDNAKSIDTMKMVVDYSMNQSDQKKGIQLQDEALKDLVRFFADADAMDEAIEYFTKLGKQDLIKTMLMRLAGMYFEQGKFDKAVDTFKRLILEDPQSADCPDYQAEINKAYRKTGNRERLLEEVDRMLRDYGKNSAWQRANASNPDSIRNANEAVEKEIRRTAVDFHNQARQLEKGRHSDASKVYDLARQAYATYLAEYPDSDKAYDVYYAYGELLYKLKDYKGAYENYMAVVRIDPQGKHSKFCAESAIFSAEEQVKQEGGSQASASKSADAKKNIEPQDLTEWEERLVGACKQYAELYPNDSKVRNAIYKSAYLLYNKYRFGEAADQFRVIIQQEPRSKEAQLAAELMLDSFVVREDWANLKENAKFYYDTEGLGNKKFKAETYTVYENASFKLIESTLEKNSDKGQAADSFVAFYEEFPEAENAALALNNASIYYYEMDRVEDAMGVRHIFVEDPKFGPETKYYYDQIAALGFDYETIADFDKAAFYYEKLWAIYPDQLKEKEKDDADADAAATMSDKAADAIYSAAVFRNAMSQSDLAIENYNQFITAFPEDSRVSDVRLTIGGIFEDKGQWAEAADTFKSYYGSPPDDGAVEYEYFARLHYGQSMEQMGKVKERDKVYVDTVEMYKKATEAGLAKGAHTEFAAEMMFMLAQPELDEYLAVEIKGRGKSAGKKAEDKALTDSLSKKTKTLVALQGTFTDLVNTGAGEWGLASLVALGKAYENMGASLINSDKPFYLTEDQVELYVMALQDKAYVQEEKAIEAYRLALSKSFELTLYNENTEFATRKLGELRPDDFPGLEEELTEPRYTSSKVRRFEFEPTL
jgi:tetratricopeptide (TPR) repeat protein